MAYPAEPLSWWTSAPVPRAAREDPPVRLTASYRLGDAGLQVEADDPALLRRFDELYGECAAPASTPAVPIRVRCAVRAAAHPCLLDLEFLEGAPPDPAASALALLHPPRGEPPYSVRPSPFDSWRWVGGASRPVVAASGSHVLIDTGRVPDDFFVEYLVSATLEAQGELIVLHAAAVRLGDKGILLAGPSRAGKTTLSAHLAARGHELLGDELAVVRMSTCEALPLRRSMSFRAGPRAPALSAKLAALAGGEPSAGGKTGSIRIDGLFPGMPARPARLCGAFFLDRFSSGAAAAPFSLSMKDANLFEYLAANDIALVSWGLTTERRTLRLLALGRMLARLPCWRLTVGPPAETAELVERTTEGR